jgi:selenoprotein W-related protein
LPRAARMASDLLERYGNAISELKLIPSGGGVYEVAKNGNLVFSKKKLNRFPEFEEIIQLID